MDPSALSSKVKSYVTICIEFFKIIIQKIGLPIHFFVFAGFAPSIVATLIRKIETLTPEHDSILDTVAQEEVAKYIQAHPLDSNMQFQPVQITTSSQPAIQQQSQQVEQLQRQIHQLQEEHERQIKQYQTALAQKDIEIKNFQEQNAILQEKLLQNSSLTPVTSHLHTTSPTPTPKSSTPIKSKQTSKGINPFADNILQVNPFDM